jgi:hypothetical protein
LEQQGLLLLVNRRANYLAGLNKNSKASFLEDLEVLGLDHLEQHSHKKDSMEIKLKDKVYLEMLIQLSW